MKETIRRYSIRGAQQKATLASLELDGDQFVVRDQGQVISVLPIVEREQALSVYGALVARLMLARQSEREAAI